MLVIDTNVLIEIARGNEHVIAKCDKIGEEKLCISPITYAEFMRGVHSKKEMAKAQKLLKSFTILPFTPKISELFVDIFNCYNLSHRPSLPDMLIASTALHYKYPLYTLNKKDFTFLQDLKLV